MAVKRQTAAVVMNNFALKRIYVLRAIKILHKVSSIHDWLLVSCQCRLFHTFVYVSGSAGSTCSCMRVCRMFVVPILL